MADTEQSLAEALNITILELKDMISPENINNKVSRWSIRIPDYVGDRLSFDFVEGESTRLLTLTILQQVMSSQLWEYVPFLIKHAGADVNCTNEDEEGQQTILHDVQRTGHPEVPVTVLRQLITPQNINMQGLYGRTALHYAAYKQNLPHIQVLIENGADINIQDKWDSTPLHYYISCYQSKPDMIDKGTVTLKERSDVIRQLISSENIDMVTVDRTALHKAIECRTCTPTNNDTELLLDHGASVNIRCDDLDQDLPLYACLSPLSKLSLSLVKRTMPDSVTEVYKAVMTLLASIQEKEYQRHQTVGNVEDLDGSTEEDVSAEVSQVLHYLLANLCPMTLDADAGRNVLLLDYEQSNDVYWFWLNGVEMVLFWGNRPYADELMDMLYCIVQHTCLVCPGVAKLIPRDLSFGPRFIDFYRIVDRLTKQQVPPLRKLCTFTVRSCVLRHSRAEGFDHLPLPPALVAELKMENLAKHLIDMLDKGVSK